MMNIRHDCLTASIRPAVNAAKLNAGAMFSKRELDILSREMKKIDQIKPKFHDQCYMTVFYGTFPCSVKMGNQLHLTVFSLISIFAHRLSRLWRTSKSAELAWLLPNIVLAAIRINNDCYEEPGPARCEGLEVWDIVELVKFICQAISMSNFYI